MRIARLETADGPRYAIRAGEGWAVVEDCFADPPILTGVTVSDADAWLLAVRGPGCWSASPTTRPTTTTRCPSGPGTSRCAALSARRGHPGPDVMSARSTVAESIVYVARWVPLGPGDVIMSGSPNTFVAVSPGDTVEIRLSGIGSLSSRVS